MKGIIRFAVVGMLSMALVACGKTKEQKDQDRADSLIEEQGKLINDLQSSSISILSSDKEIDAYEAKLNRLEAVESELRSLNGQSGIKVSGGNTGKFFQDIRDNIALIRAEKKSSSKAS